jgi:hypothetical protein
MSTANGKKIGIFIRVTLLNLFELKIQGDDDRFAHFVRLLAPDLFSKPHRLSDKAGEIRRHILRLGPDCPWALRRPKEDLKDLNGRRLFPDRFAHTVAFGQGPSDSRPILAYRE